MKIELKNKFIPNFVYCLDIMKIDATFWFNRKEKAAKLAEYVMTKPDETTYVEITYENLKRYFLGIEYLKLSIGTIPTDAVDDFLDTLETVKLIKEQIETMQLI